MSARTKMKTPGSVQQQCRNAALEKITVFRKLDGEVSDTVFIFQDMMIMM